jgi:hypothetical protein
MWVFTCDGECLLTMIAGRLRLRFGVLDAGSEGFIAFKNYRYRSFAIGGLSV